MDNLFVRIAPYLAKIEAAFAHDMAHVARRVRATDVVSADEFEAASRRIRADAQRYADTRDLIGAIAQGMKDGHTKAQEAERKAEAEQVVAAAIERTIAFR